jgi:glycosyltransferase involved in cell wall biosynthesis
MRLLIVSAYFETHRGGIEMVAGALAKEFRRAGQTVTWIASDADPIPPDDLSGRRVPIRAWNGTEKILGIPFPIPGPSALKIIRREVAAADVVMIHDALYPANIAAFLFARWLGKPVMVTQHIGAIPYSNPVLRVLLRSMNRIVTRPVLSAADQVVYISKLTAETFRTVACRRPPQIIFNGVDTAIFHPASDAAERSATRQRFGLSPDRPVALFVGRFVEKKGLNILRHAARMAGDIDWVFAGWGTIDPSEWKLPNVRVLPGLNQASLAPLYRASDIFVLPSVGEGFPLVLQEAAVSGLAAICGAESAKADERLGSHLYPVPIEGRDSTEVATDVLAAVRQAIAEHDPDQAAARSALVGGWYSWARGAGLYLDLFSDMLRTNGAGVQAVPDGLPTARADRRI